MIISESRKHRRNIHLLNTKERLSSGMGTSHAVPPTRKQGSKARSVQSRDAAVTSRLGLGARDACAGSAAAGASKGDGRQTYGTKEAHVLRPTTFHGPWRG